MADKHSYHVILANGSERDVKADDYTIDENGTLFFLNDKSKKVVTYSASAWAMVELEIRDDRG